jgi:hypothetical protein
LNADSPSGLDDLLSPLLDLEGFDADIPMFGNITSNQGGGVNVTGEQRPATVVVVVLQPEQYVWGQHQQPGH